MRVKAKRGLNQDAIVREAASICDEYGVEKLSIAALADRLGVRPPSLYNHIKNLDHIYSLMALMGIRLWTESIQEAVESSTDGKQLRAVAHASRAFAQDQPTLFFCATRKFAASGDAFVEAAMPMLSITGEIYSSMVGDPRKRNLAEYLFRCLIAGFISLESNNGLQPAEDLDSLYDELIDLAESALRS